MELNFKNKRDVRPRDVRALDAFAIKIVAWANVGGTWAAYWGPADWTDERVARAGEIIDESAARSLFYVLDKSKIPYGEF